MTLALCKCSGGAWCSACLLMNQNNMSRGTAFPSRLPMPQRRQIKLSIREIWSVLAVHSVGSRPRIQCVFRNLNKYLEFFVNEIEQYDSYCFCFFAALALYIHVHSTESSSTNSLSDTSTTITYVSENTTITPVPENTTITSLYETTASQLETTTTVRPTVCYDSVGCFNNLPPFDNAQEALPLSPERIGTKFLLYTSKDPDSNETFFINHVNETLLDESGYDPKLPTKFVIHGFINTIKTEWLYEMKDALLRKVLKA